MKNVICIYIYIYVAFSYIFPTFRRTKAIISNFLQVFTCLNHPAMIHLDVHQSLGGGREVEGADREVIAPSSCGQRGNPSAIERCSECLNQGGQQQNPMQIHNPKHI